MEMIVQTLSKGYPTVLHRILTWGELVSPRGDPTRELLGAQLTVMSTDDVLPLDAGRGVNKNLAIELALQLIGGVYLPERLALSSPFFVDDPKLENYGPLLAPGIARSIEYLQADPHTRRAAANLGHIGGDSGYPCTVSLGWAIRDGCLHGFSEMRSQDAWLGLPYDLYMFAALQRSMAWTLGVEPGPMHHRVRSFHLYERDVLKAAEVRPGRRRATLQISEPTWDRATHRAREHLGLLW